MTPHPAIAGALGAATFGAIAVASGAGPVTVARLSVFGAAAGAAALIDARERRIPNRLVLPATAACLALSVVERPPWSGVLAGAAVLAVLFAVSVSWPAALGVGDVKLAALVLAGLDGQAAQALILGLALAAILGAGMLVRHGRAAGRQTLPLAPFLACGCLVAVLL